MTQIKILICEICFIRGPLNRLHHDKLKEALIKYDRLLACRALTHIVAQDRRQANSLSYLIRASFSLSRALKLDAEGNTNNKNQAASNSERCVVM